MTEDNVQLEEFQAPTFVVPLCDDEDEPVASGYEREPVDSSDDDVEAHGGSGFTQPA